MPLSVRCVKCSAGLRVADKYLGKTIRCPRCQADILVTAPRPVETYGIQGGPPPAAVPIAPPPPAFMVAQLAQPDRPEAVSEAEPVAESRRRKRKKKPKGFFESLGLPPITIEGGVIKLVVGLVCLLVGSYAGYHFWKFASRYTPPPVIPEEQWRPFEIAGRVRTRFPGTPKRVDLPLGPLTMVMHTYEPEPHSSYAVAYTEGTLPPERRNLPAETLLNDACDGSVANLEKMGGKEVRRESIQLGPYPGKKLLVEIPKVDGYVVAHCYMAGGRLYLAMAGGAGLDESHANVQRFLAAFEILDPGTPPAAPPPPPVVRQPEPAAPRAEGPPREPDSQPRPPVVRNGRDRAPRVERPVKPPAPPPVVRLELPPLPDPVPVRPAPIKKETPYKLPEPVRALRVGGGGRFLVLHFPNARKFGVFDANEAKIVRYVPAGEDDVHFAAGMTQLVVYLPGSKVLQRYDLLTGQREHLGKLELPDGKVEAFCMGHASAGPLLIGVAGQGTRLFDIADFREIPLPPSDRDRGGAAPRRLSGGLYWAGATGRVFGHTGNYGMPNGVRTVVFEGGQVQEYGEHKGTWFVMPGPDDRHVYAGGHGVVSERVRPVPNVPFSMGPNSGFASHLYLPAHHGPYYLHAQTIGDLGGQGGGTPVGTVQVYVLGDKQPIATYLKTAVAKYGWEGLRGLGIEHSLHLIPKAKLLVIVPETRDELRLYPADLEAALDKSGRDHLVFTSTPPARFQKGKLFTYAAEARAKKRPVTYQLESGPPGMAVSDKGVVTWAVPADFAEKRVEVILAAKDAEGQEAFQTLTLTEGGGG